MEINSRILPLDTNTRCGFGPFHTGNDDPFHASCVTHDKRYESHHTGSNFEKLSREHVDKEFLDNMLEQAGQNIRLKVRAYIYYGLARVFGWLLW